MTTIFDEYFKDISDSYSKMFKLAAIWTDLRYNVVRNGQTEETRRITNGDQVIVVDGYVCSCDDSAAPTHEVVNLFGTLQNNRLELECINLSNRLTEIIKLK